MASVGAGGLSESDRVVIERCLRAAVDGPFFPDWEFHTLFGLDRDEVREVLDAWPDLPGRAPEGYASPEHVQRTAVGNTLNNLLGYPHGVEPSEFEGVIGATPRQIAKTLMRWRGEERFDPSAGGHFDRMM